MHTPAASSPPAPSFRFAALMILLIFGGVEGIAAIFFAVYGDRIPLPDPTRYLAEDKDLDFAASIFDAELGWKNRYATPYGERPRAVDRGRPLVSAYGDSFTHADEVAHTESWAEQLGALIDADVLNFGGGAYGTDQALLRFEQMFPKRPTPVVLFGFITNDIERNVSVYWRFLYPQQTLSLTKPRFLLREDSLELLPNPASTTEELRAGLQDPRWIEEIGANDWWYNPRSMPKRGFPHLRLFFEKGFWTFARHGQTRDRLWELEEPQRIFELILRRLQEQAEAAGADLHVIHFPVVWEVEAFRKHDILPKSVRSTRKMCERAGLQCHFPLLVTGDLTEDAVRVLFTKGLEGGHYSVEGNRHIAHYLAETIDFAAASAASARNGAAPPADPLDLPAGG